MVEVSDGRMTHRWNDTPGDSQAVVLTAIIHLRQAPDPRQGGGVPDLIGGALRRVRGVEGVNYEATDDLVTVRFDHAQAGLADLVRQLEDTGCEVASVARRSLIEADVAATS